ncbi:MAG TPA: class I SAM-dependent methyltransferase [Geminicoccaceae bacterium]|nr:class I SAM-dependent methyltransferase [Geminicoccaceae bacterium]
MRVNFGRTASDYARHRAGFPEALFDRLVQNGMVAAGQRLLDLGTGTGSLARGFARRGLLVTGLDPARPLLDQARRLDAAAGVAVEYLLARAESTGLPDASFDVVSAGQCWHWFERARAAQEVRRLLRPGGRVVIAHFDWLPLAGNVVEATERLIRQHNPDWTHGGGTGLHPAWLADLALAGFTRLETFSFDHAIDYSHAAWRGRIRASAGIAASLDAAAVARFDAAHEALLARDFPDQPLRVPHRCWAAIGVNP